MWSRRLSLLALSIGSVAFLGACADSDTSGGSTAASSGTIPRVITVHGVGSTKVSPDVLSIELGAEATAATAGAAFSQVGTASQAISGVLQAHGVAAADIQTTQVFLSATYDYQPTGSPKISGYVASVSISAKLHDVTGAPGLLDDASTAAGDAFRLRGLSWTVDDPTSALDTARAAAVTDATKRAQALAEAAGVKVGRVESINEVSQNVVVPGASEGGKDTGGGVVLSPGVQSITVTVDVIFAIA